MRKFGQETMFQGKSNSNLLKAGELQNLKLKKDTELSKGLQ